MTVGTIAYHVCKKEDITPPNIAALYTQLLGYNNGYAEEVLLNPEYYSHENWNDEAAWIAANFQNIPIMVDVAGGWTHQTTPAELDALKEQPNMDIRWLRISEFISWCLEQQIEFPASYIASILSWCRTNSVKLYWCEWKVDYALGTAWEVPTFDLIKDLIVGYEDIVYVAFKTNSGDLEPDKGFEYVKNMGFQHRGATVESWYWETRHRQGEWLDTPIENPDNMPVSWMVRHVKEAIAAGVEAIQFEPYWYFWDKTTGQPLESLMRINAYLPLKVMSEPTHVTILETIKAEWQASQAKTGIAWLPGKAEADWFAQRFSYDFAKMKQKYAVSCYIARCSSLTRNTYLRDDVVAVDVHVKVIGNSIEQAEFIRAEMAGEVERILGMYNPTAPLWDINQGPTGAYKHRRVPGISRTVQRETTAQTTSPTMLKTSFLVDCRIFPKKVVN